MFRKQIIARPFSQIDAEFNAIEPFNLFNIELTKAPRLTDKMPKEYFLMGKKTILLDGVNCKLPDSNLDKSGFRLPLIVKEKVKRNYVNTRSSSHRSLQHEGNLGIDHVKPSVSTSPRMSQERLDDLQRFYEKEEQKDETNTLVAKVKDGDKTVFVYVYESDRESPFDIDLGDMLSTIKETQDVELLAGIIDK
jgi:hypothetical protein